MIKQITPKNVWDLLSNALVITTQATVFSYKPQEESVPNWAYIYSDCTTLTRNYADNMGELTRVSTVTIYVVWPKSHATKLDEVVVDEVIDALNNYLITEDCYGIDKIDDINIVAIQYRFTSPMGYTEKNRPIRTVTYDIKYWAIQS